MLDGLENASSEMVEAKVSLLSFILHVIRIFYLSRLTHKLCFIYWLSYDAIILNNVYNESTQYFVKLYLIYYFVYFTLPLLSPRPG